MGIQHQALSAQDRQRLFDSIGSFLCFLFRFNLTGGGCGEDCFDFRR